MVELYAYRHANVNGDYTTMQPAGTSKLPSEKVNTITELFANENDSILHGMWMERLQQQEAWYMYASRQRQSEATAIRKSYCTDAQMSRLEKSDFFDENLDNLVGHYFPDENTVVNNLPTVKKYRPPIHDYTIDPKVLEAIIHGCFARWSSKEDPVYIVLPDEDFDCAVLCWRKAIYLAMPYALRARAGYATWPTPKCIHEFIYLFFLPECEAHRFKDEPLLYPLSCQCADNINKILSRSLSQDLCI